MSQIHEHKSDFIKGLSSLIGISHEKIKDYAKDNNLLNILHHPGTISPSKKQLEKISLINEIISNYSILKLHESEGKIRLNTSSKAGNYFAALLGGIKDKEKFLVAFLDSQNNIIETRTCFEGTIDEAAVYPREILKAALGCDCKTIILAHNHPGGEQEPSQCDIKVTQKLVEVFNAVDINVADHIIVTSHGYLSMAERGYSLCAGSFAQAAASSYPKFEEEIER